MDDFRMEVDEHGNIKVTSYVETVVLSKEEQEQALRIFKQLQDENARLRETCFDAHRWMDRALYDGSARRYEYESITERMRELGVEVD